MQNVSTNLTLFLKIFIPTFWIVFFGLFTVSTYVKDIYIGSLTPWLFRLTCTLFFLTGLALLYFTLMQIKRVDMDETYLYVSNYFKTIRYPYSLVEKVDERDFLFFHLIHIHFKQKGQFGKKIVFLSRGKKLDRFLRSHPDIARQLMSDADQELT